MGSSRPAPASDIDLLVARLHEEIDLGAPTTVDPAAPLTSSAAASRPTPTVTTDGPRGIEFDPTIASFAARVVGLVVDALVLCLLVAPGVLVALRGDSGPAAVGGIVLALFGFVAAMTLYLRSVGTSGRSLGNRVARTQVVDARNGSPIGRQRAGTRFFIRFVLSPVFLLGYLPAIFDAQRRTFHDNAVGSIVTGRDRQSWSIGDDGP